MKEINLDILENADDEVLRSMSEKFSPVSEKDISRLYKKTEEKYGMKSGGAGKSAKSGGTEDYEKVNVVEYRRPVFRKTVAATAAFVLLSAAGAAGYSAFREHRENVPAYTDGIAEDESAACYAFPPFGDISDAKIRFVTTAYAPYILDTTPEEAAAFSVWVNDCYAAEPWTVYDEGREWDGESMLVFVDTGDRRFCLKFSGEDILEYDDGTEKTRYIIGENQMSGLNFFTDSENKRNQLIWSKPEDITIDGVWKNNEHVPEKIFEPAVNESLKDCDIRNYEPLLEYDLDYSKIENVVSRSENIVTGVVDKIDYCEETLASGGMPYILVRLHVTGDVKGKFSEGEHTDLRMPGGFISMRGMYGDTLYATGGKYGDGIQMTEDEIDRTWYHEIIDSGEVPVEGKEYAFFIADYRGSHEITGGEHGIFYKCDNTFIGMERIEYQDGYSAYSYVFYDKDELMEMVE